MAYNYDIGPARYQGMQQQRKDEWFRMMMNMFLMSKRMKMTKEEQGREQQRWEAMQPYYQARTDALKAQAERQRRPAPLPSHIQEYLWWRQTGLPEKEARNLTYNIKPEQKSRIFRQAQEMVDVGLSSTLQEAYKTVLERSAQAEFTGYQKHRIREDKVDKTQNMIKNAIKAIDTEIKTAEKGSVDLKTGNIIEADPAVVNNLRQATDTLRSIDAKVARGEGTEQDVALAAKIYGSINRIKKEGAFWEYPQEVLDYHKKHPKLSLRAIYELWKKYGGLKQ